MYAVNHTLTIVGGVFVFHPGWYSWYGVLLFLGTPWFGSWTLICLNIRLRIHFTYLGGWCLFKCVHTYTSIQDYTRTRYVKSLCSLSLFRVRCRPCCFIPHARFIPISRLSRAHQLQEGQSSCPMPYPPEVTTGFHCHIVASYIYIYIYMCVYIYVCIIYIDIHICIIYIYMHYIYILGVCTYICVDMI